MKLGMSLLLLAVVGVSPEIRYFRYDRAIQSSGQSSGQQSGQTCVAIDSGIFAHAAPQLADLRLFRGTTETPYVLNVVEAAEPGLKEIQPLNKGLQGRDTVFDAELPDARYSDVELAVTAKDFIATVTVSGSHTQGAAETRLGSYTIFDLTGQRLGRSTVLHLPESDLRFLHFQIAGPVTPENLTGLSVERLPANKPKYDIVAQSSAIARKDHSSIVEFAVPAHVPIDRIAFSLGAEPALFSREVTVSAAPASPASGADGVETAPPVTSSGNILRIHRVQDGRRIDEERLTVAAPFVDFATGTTWKVTIENGDDTPLAINSVRLEMLERRLCFEADAQGSYELFYGDPALSPAHYDYAAFFSAKAAAAAAATGAEELNPAFQARPDERPFTEKHPALLWLALIAVIALLGGIALRTAKRTPPPQS